MLSAFRRFPGILNLHASSKPPSPWVGRILGIDLRSVALFRICLGLLLLMDLMIRAVDLRAFYTDLGVLPRASFLSGYPENDWLYSFHFMSGAAFFQILLFWAAAVAVISLMLGYRTKVAAVVSFVFLCSLQNRNPFVLQGGDMLLRVMHFWALFLPLGLRWSVDSYRLPQKRPLGVHPETPDLVVTFASAAILFQVAFLYWFTAGLKSDPIWWRDGLGIYYSLSVDQFVTPLGVWLREREWLHRPLSYATYFLEAFGPLFVLIPWRTAWFRLAAVAVFLVFHLFGIRLTMNLGLFPWTCGAIWLLFLPGLFWDQLVPKALRWFWLNLTRLDQTPRQRFWIRRSLSVLKLGFRSSRRLAPLREAGWGILRFGLQSGVVAFLLLYVLAWNIRASDFDRYVRYFPRKWNWIGEVTGLHQYWSMFSPKPMIDDGWYVFTGRTKGGKIIDMRTGAPVTWRKPDWVSATYKNQRWRKYLMNLRLGKNQKLRDNFIRWMMNTWNEGHPDSDKVIAMQLIYVKEMTTRHGTAPVDKLVLHEFNPIGDWRKKRKK